MPHDARALTAFGGHSGGGTPLPIPNREVKPASADGTWGATPWESRSPPNSSWGRAARVPHVFGDPRCARDRSAREEPVFVPLASRAACGRALRRPFARTLCRARKWLVSRSVGEPCLGRSELVAPVRVERRRAATRRPTAGCVSKSAATPSRFEGIDDEEGLGGGAGAEVDQLDRLLEAEEGVGQAVGVPADLRRGASAASSRLGESRACTIAEAIGPKTKRRARRRKPPTALSSTSVAATTTAAVCTTTSRRSEVRDFVRERRPRAPPGGTPAARARRRPSRRAGHVRPRARTGTGPGGRRAGASPRPRVARGARALRARPAPRPSGSSRARSIPRTKRSPYQ